MAPLEGDTHDEQVAARLAYAAKHLANLQDFVGCRLTQAQLKEGAALLHGLTVMVQTRHTQNMRKSMAAWMCTSFDSGGGQVFKFLKGSAEPDTMTSALFSSITTDPMQVLEEKLVEWRAIWKCDDRVQREKACRAIRAAIAEALAAGNYVGAIAELHSGGDIVASARSFKRTTSIGGDNWPFHEIAKVGLAATLPSRNKNAFNPCSSSSTLCR